MAKRFFYVCAGILCLAFSLQLAHIAAQAQSGVTVEGACIQSIQDNTFPRATGCVGRLFYWMGENGATHPVPVPVPGTRRIVATDPYQTVMLENGDWLKFDGNSWVLIGNLVGAPTATRAETWGGVKARYRN